MDKEIFKDIILRCLIGLRDNKCISQERLKEVMELLSKPEEIKEEKQVQQQQNIKYNFDGVDLE